MQKRRIFNPLFLKASSLYRISEVFDHLEFVVFYYSLITIISKPHKRIKQLIKKKKKKSFINGSDSETVKAVDKTLTVVVLTVKHQYYILCYITTLMQTLETVYSIIPCSR